MKGGINKRPASRLALPLLGMSCMCVAGTVMANTGSDGLEAVTVTATKMGIKLGDVTQPVSVIGEEEIKAKAQVDLTEVLRTQPSIEFKKAGGPGQFNYIRLRGFSDSILFVMDGAVMNDGNSGGIGNVVGQVDPSVVSRVEILRGPHATLYGANTTAGVISITTKGGETPDTSVSAETGSLGWKKGRFSWRNNMELGSGKLNYALNGSVTDSDGVHQYEFYKDKTVSGKLSYVTDAFEVGTSLYRTDNRFGYAELKEASCCQTPATYWSFQVPDPDQYSRTVDTIGTVWARQQINSDWSQRLQLSAMQKRYDTFDPNNGLLGMQPAPLNNFVFNGVTYAKGALMPVPDSTTNTRSFTTGNNRQADYNLIYGTDAVTALVGAGYLQQKYSSSGSFGASNTEQNLKSVYTDVQVPLLDKKLHVEAGARLDDYNAWGNQSTYSIGTAYDITPGIAVYANYGTSFTQPTLSQLFNPTYGHSTLSPASGKTIEGGIRQSAFNDRLTLNFAVYDSRVDNVIVFDSNIPNSRATSGFGLYNNRDGAKSQGAELQVRYQLRSDLYVDASHTYTDAAVQNANGSYSRMIQVAHNKTNIGLNYQGDKLALGLSTFYVGPRLRWAADVNTESYWRVDLSGRYQVLDSVSVYARVQNALNSNLIEEIGYEQPRLYAIAGVDLKF